MGNLRPLPKATWGADPLEFYGGFRNLEYDQEAKFPSSLAPNATVSWFTVEAQQSSCDTLSAQLALSVAFPNVDLESLQRIYGWAALQYQGWARGLLHVNGPQSQTLTLATDNLLEFYLDGVHHFGGDYYAFRKAPIVLHLEPGEHIIDLRLVRDVRAMGGVGSPTIDFQLEARASTKDLHIANNNIIMPDMVGGRLASMLGSIQVRNDHVHDIEVLGVTANDSSYFVWLLQPENFRVVSGQTRHVSVAISCESNCSPYLGIDIEYRVGGKPRSPVSVLHVDYKFTQPELHKPLKVTLYHPGGMVSYAILRPPPMNVTCPLDSEGSLPVLLQLHGAGVEADNDIVRHALDPLSDLCAWALFPTGSTPWSGDDWHVWGFADVEAAVRAIPGWIESIGWTGPGVNTKRWLVSGHSNGGECTCEASTRSAPISGYSSIQNYVPYDLWQPMSPSVRALLDASLSSYRHETLLENVKGIHIQQQHGSIDDNVPVFHSRLMSQLIKQAGANSSYTELPNKNHWFDGIMTTETLSQFFKQELNGFARPLRTPEAFTLAVANPADSGPKFGVEILHLRRPGQLGKIHVSLSSSVCFIQSSNVLSLRLPKICPRTHDVVVDGQKISLPVDSEKSDLWLLPDGTWKVLSEHRSPALRHRNQLGGMDALFRTQNTLQIVSHSQQARRVALQMSRNLCQYLGADTEVLDSGNEPSRQYSNIIRVLISSDPPASHLGQFALQVDASSGISIRTTDGHMRYPSSAGLGAIFLRPLPEGAVELVVWGHDAVGLDVASRLVPMLPGVGQPDFVVADKKMLQMGAGGVLAMGSFDHLWNVTGNSYFT
ncbi:hypothetical protein E4T38_09937 [Aureobasidium subglaciale]|nr:hypothetical protein E4T38_09937 [Aureobasidium subglaciale]KAI5213063.1 hypothetical protein E4T40_09941 [Aureobasidium subglaciale]KAI5214194.1 hypothetical protein E4T41_09950 [Aureobasidium subglaciale]KAI5252324.1 hypothetical protein E4T46_09939 [Aureobasidium subglaciale]